jgi:hypothetical protein
MGLGAAAWRISEMQMPDQNAKLMSAVFAGVLVCASFTPALISFAQAEDSCLAAPSGETPHGSHWRYRVERGTKRHCWYLRNESDAAAPSQSAAATSSPAPVPAKPPAQKAETPVQGAVANARAELPWPQPRSMPDTPAPAAEAPAVAATDAPSSNSDLPATSPATDSAVSTPPASIASRWPDQLNANAPDDSVPEADHLATTAQPETAAAPSPPPAVAAPLATADATPPSSKQPGSMQMLLTIMISALALAGLVAGAILKFSGRKRDNKEREFNYDRRAPWDIERNDHALPYPATARPNIGRPRELRTVEPDDAIKEMLARLARSAQT